MGQSTYELYAIDAIERACTSQRNLREAIDMEINELKARIRLHLLSHPARKAAAQLLHEGRIHQCYRRGETWLEANPLKRSDRL